MCCVGASGVSELSVTNGVQWIECFDLDVFLWASLKASSVRSGLNSAPIWELVGKATGVYAGWPVM